MMSKPTGAGDYNVIQEDYDIIGTARGTRRWWSSMLRASIGD